MMRTLLTEQAQNSRSNTLPAPETRCHLRAWSAHWGPLKEWSMHNWEAFYNTYFNEANRAFIGRWTAAHGDASAKHMLAFIYDGSLIIGMVGRNADHPLLGTVEELSAGKRQPQHPAAAVVANCSSHQPPPSPPTRITTSTNTQQQHTTTPRPYHIANPGCRPYMYCPW